MVTPDPEPSIEALTSRPSLRHAVTVWLPAVVALLALVFAGNLIFSPGLGSGLVPGSSATPRALPDGSTGPTPSAPSTVATPSISASPTRSPATVPTRTTIAPRPSSSSPGGAGTATGPVLVPIVVQTAHVHGINGLCLDDESGRKTNGTAAQLWQCEELEQQYWTFTASGTLEVFGRCLRAAEGATLAGSLVELWSCDGSAAQRWQFDSAGHLVNRAAGLCLNDPTLGTDNGIQLDLAVCRTAAAQQWSMG